MDINCKKCGNLADEVQGCKCYGSDPTKAVKACAADGFKNYTGAMKPEKYDVDRFDYFTKRYRCPVCGSYLASYNYGRAYTPDGLYPDQLIDCTDCGQAIDWSAEPRAKEIKP